MNYLNYLNQTRNQSTRGNVTLRRLFVIVSTALLLMLPLGHAGIVQASPAPSGAGAKEERQHMLGHDQRIILIDAGHGGIDGGTSYGTILERISRSLSPAGCSCCCAVTALMRSLTGPVTMPPAMRTAGCAAPPAICGILPSARSWPRRFRQMSWSAFILTGPLPPPNTGRSCCTARKAAASCWPVRYRTSSISSIM